MLNAECVKGLLIDLFEIIDYLLIWVDIIQLLSLSFGFICIQKSLL